MKTSELQDLALNYAVALALKITPVVSIQSITNRTFEPSSKWSQGGPIIEREKISVIGYTDQWEACADVGIYVDNYQGDWISGPTALIAAMRCYVASKIGDEVEIPKELL
jgi:hypothetical protein